MRQYTNLYGVLSVTCQNTSYEVVVSPKTEQVLFPISPRMSEQDILRILLNHRVFDDKRNRDRLAVIGRTLHTMREKVFAELKKHSVVLSADFFDLPDELQATRIGNETTFDNCDIMLPNTSPVTCVANVYPTPFKETVADMYAISDYLAEVSDHVD